MEPGRRRGGDTDDHAVVEQKNEAQFDVQTLPRMRDLLERGITIPQGRRKLAEHLAMIRPREATIRLAHDFAG
jgi:hypothetical protein